jgi:hypothetical protein
MAPQTHHLGHFRTGGNMGETPGPQSRWLHILPATHLCFLVVPTWTPCVCEQMCAYTCQRPLSPRLRVPLSEGRLPPTGFEVPWSALEVVHMVAQGGHDV